MDREIFLNRDGKDKDYTEADWGEYMEYHGQTQERISPFERYYHLEELAAQDIFEKDYSPMHGISNDWAGRKIEKCQEGRIVSIFR